MTGAGSRRKGHNFERDIANLLKPIFRNARRGLQYQDGTGAPDVIGTPFHIECKRGRKTNIKAAIEQALADATTRALSELFDGEPPEMASPLPVAAVTKDDGDRILVTMLFEDWKELVAGVYGQADSAADPGIAGSGTGSLAA